MAGSRDMASLGKGEGTVKACRRRLMANEDWVTGMTEMLRERKMLVELRGDDQCAVYQLSLF